MVLSNVAILDIAAMLTGPRIRLGPEGQIIGAESAEQVPPVGIVADPRRLKNPELYRIRNRHGHGTKKSQTGFAYFVTPVKSISTHRVSPTIQASCSGGI